jgi:hypothetical protein
VAQHKPRNQKRWPAALVELGCEEKVRRALAAGWKIGQEGDSAGGKFVYFQNGGVPGTVVEMSDLTPTRRKIFDGVREAAVNWNGKDPIRPMASLSATL